jgi:hypothetical protein
MPFLRKDSKRCNTPCDSKRIHPFFYEALVAKFPFWLTTWVTPSILNRARGFLLREAAVCLERTSIDTRAMHAGFGELTDVTGRFSKQKQIRLAICQKTVSRNGEASPLEAGLRMVKEVFPVTRMNWEAHQRLTRFFCPSNVD